MVFTSHVEQTKARLDALDARMHDTQSNLTSRNDELSSIDTRLQTLRSIVSSLQERNDLGERLAELMREVGTAKDMLHGTSVPSSGVTLYLLMLSCYRNLRLASTGTRTDGRGVGGRQGPPCRGGRYRH